MLLDFLSRYYREDFGNKPLGSISLDEAMKQRARVDIRAERYAARIPKLRQTTFQQRQIADSNWALLGDAAGLADPITGEGIYYALRSAELFANSYLSGKAHEYERQSRGEFGKELMRAANLRTRFYGNFLGSAFTNRMIEFSLLHSGIRHTLVELIAGERMYSGLKRTLLRRLIFPNSV